MLEDKDKNILLNIYQINYIIYLFLLSKIPYSSVWKACPTILKQIKHVKKLLKKNLLKKKSHLKNPLKISVKNCSKKILPNLTKISV